MNIDKHCQPPAAGEPDSLAIRPVTRRAFFGLAAAVGALTFVGASPSGRVQAWADENGSIFFVVYILSKEQVPVMAFDVSGETPKPLEGVTVVIADAEDSKKAVTVTTNAEGFAPANIRAISRQSKDDTAITYNLFASLTATNSKGYREYYEESTFVEAGTPCDDQGNRTNTIVIATQPINNTPYIRQFTICGEDAQYVCGVEVPVWDGSDAQHTIAVEIDALAARATVEISILINGKVRTTQTVMSDASTKRAKATFTDQWLKILKAGDKLGVSFKVNNGKTYTDTSPLSFIDPLCTNANNAIDRKFNISMGSEKGKAEWRYWTGFLNRPGDSFECAMPFVPVTMFVDTKGRIGICATLVQVTFLKLERGEDPVKMEGESLLKKYNGRSMKEGWGDYKNKVSSNWTKFTGLFHNRNNDGIGWDDIPARFTYSIGLNAKVDAIGYGYFIIDKGQRQGYLDAGLRGSFGASVVFSIQFMAGVLPLIVTFDASLTIALSTMYGMLLQRLIDTIAFSANPLTSKANPPHFTFLIKLDFGATVAVGVMGIVSAGIRGYAYMIFDVDGNLWEDKPWPHSTFKIGANFDVVVQVFFVKKTWTITKFKPWKAYDNWEKKLSEGENEVMEGVNLTDMDFEDFEQVTDTDLFSVVESEGSWETNGPVPVFTAIHNDAISDAEFPTFGVIDLLNADDDEKRSPLNGSLPKVKYLPLYHDCYSNPRMRIVHTDTESFKNDRAFMVRLVVTEINVPATTSAFGQDAVYYEGEQVANGANLVVETADGNMMVVPSEAPANGPQKVTRTRLAISEWSRDRKSWSDAHIVEFVVPGEITSLDRLNSHDIDFDIDFYNGSMLIAITSMQRPAGAAPTYLEYESRQYLSLVRWDINEKVVKAAGSTFSLLNNHAAGSNSLSLFHPRILMQNFDEGSGATLHAVVYTYACTYTADKAARTAGYLAATVFDDMQKDGFMNHRFSNPVTIVPSAMEGLDVDHLVAGTFEVACPNRLLTVKDEATKRNQTTAIFSWSHPGDKREGKQLAACSFVFCETFSVVAKKTATDTKYESSVNQRSVLRLRKVPSVSRLGVTNQKALFSYADFRDKGNQKPLKTVTFDQNTLQLGVLNETTQTDKVQYFPSFNGRRLYCVRTIKGEAPSLSESTLASIKAGNKQCVSNGPFNLPTPKSGFTGGEVELYQLCEARWVDELQSYYDFYPIAQIERIPDNIGVIAASKSWTHFTMATITDFENNMADIYQVDVEVIISAMALSAEPMSPFAAVGDTCRYMVEIANVGSTPITAITMETLLDGKVVHTEEYKNLKDYVMHSSKAKVSYVEADGADEYSLDSYAIETDEDDVVQGTTERDAIPFAGILWPGKRLTFCFGFKVPEIPGGAGRNVTFGVRIKSVADYMDDNSFTWPEEVVALTAQDEGDGVPLFANDDYLYQTNDEILSVLADDPLLFDAQWEGDQFTFEASVGSANYLWDGEEPGGSDAPVATGDGTMGVVAAAAATAAVAAGVAGAAAKKARDASSSDQE